MGFVLVCLIFFFFFQDLKTSVLYVGVFNLWSESYSELMSSLSSRE